MRSDPRERSMVTARDHRIAVFCVALMVIGCAVAIVVPAGLGWDFANFYDAGRRVAAGQAANLYDPQSLIGGLPPQGKTGFFGTPISALFYVPMSPFSPEVALVLFKVENVISFAAAFFLLFTLHRELVGPSASARSRFAAIFCVLCLIYQPFWTVFRVGGQTTPTVLALLAAALIFHTRGAPWGTVVCTVLATLIKPALAPALLLLLVISGVRVFWRGTVALLAAGVVSMAVLGWPVHAAFLQLMRTASQIRYAWYYNSSLFVLINTFRDLPGAPPETATAHLIFTTLTFGLKVFAIGTVVAFLLRARRQSWTGPARRHFQFLMAIVLFLLWSDTLWEHYLSLLFIPLIYVVAVRDRFPPGAMNLVWAIFVVSVAQNLILVDWIRAHVDITSVPALVTAVVIKTAPLTLLLVFLFRHGPEFLASYGSAAWQRPETERR